MDFNEFNTKIENVIKTKLPDCNVEIRSIVKNNNVILHGLTIKADNINAAPTIYTEQFYESLQDGEDIEDIVEGIMGLYNTNKLNEDYDFSFIEEYNRAKHKIYLKAVNFKSNEAFLKDVPYFTFNDLALVPYILIDDEVFGCATVVVHNDLLNNWCVSERQLHKDAMFNMEYDFEYEFKPITHVLSELHEDFPKINDDDMGMYVLSSKNRLYGAGLIAVNSVLSKIADELNSDFYIIPSSVHELIIIKSADENIENNLKDMIQEVNETVVSAEDILSDHAYYFDYEWGITQ